MATQKDFLGYPYDDAHPAFITLPFPPHPMTPRGSNKFVYHRPTGRIYDYDKLVARMAASDYNPGPVEFGDDDDWLDENTDLGPGSGSDDTPKEFTLTLNTATSRSYALHFTMTGGPATVRQQVRLNANVGGQKLLYPAYNPSVDSFWIEVGDDAAAVLAKLDVLDIKTGVSETPDFDQNIDIEYGLDTTAKNAADVQFAGRMNFGPLNPADANKYLGPEFDVIGMNVVGDVPAKPQGDVTSTLAADGMSATVKITGGPLPAVPYTTYLFNMRALGANGEPAALSTNGQKVEVEIAAGLSNADMAAALATGLDGLVMPIQNSPGPFTMHAVQNAAPNADSITITITKTDSGDAAKMDYPPYFQIY